MRTGSSTHNNDNNKKARIIWSSFQEEQEDSNRQEGKTTSYSARYIEDNGLRLTQDEEGRVTAHRPRTIASTSETSNTDNSDAPPETEIETSTTKKQQQNAPIVEEQKPQVVPKSGFNVVLTHTTADFDSLASAVGLAKLWSHNYAKQQTSNNHSEFDSTSHLPTFVVLPRGAHPSVSKFLSLHKHVFPIRSLKSLPKKGLNRLGLVDAQRRDRVGPAEPLIGLAKRITVVDHHMDMDSDIPEATDYVVDRVGSVSTLIVERLKAANLILTEAEATLLALGIHADTGSLCFDSTTPRDAQALAWLLGEGASQNAIAQHVQSSLSTEQQSVLTQALMNTNSTTIHGVTISTVLLQADGFINGLATVTQDALELSSSDVFVLGLVYDPKSGRRSNKNSNNNNNNNNNNGLGNASSTANFQAHLLLGKPPQPSYTLEAEAWKGGVEHLYRRRLRAAFNRRDLDGSGFLEKDEILAALSTSGTVLKENTFENIMTEYDQDEDGKIDFDEFVAFAKDAQEWQAQAQKRPSTLILIGRAKAGVKLKSVRLHDIMERYGGGGHAKAASATVRLAEDDEAEGILQDFVQTLIDDSLSKQLNVGDFMTSPVLSASPNMTEKQVEDLFTTYNVRALPVVDKEQAVVGLVTYKEVAAAKQRLWNKEQKRLRQEASGKNKNGNAAEGKKNNKRKLGSALKGWMKQHVTTIPHTMTMAEVEAVLLENDVGCVPVVTEGTNQLVGMVTRTDLLRQHRYYNSLHYHNKGFSNSIAARKPIIELRKKLKQFDLEEE